VLSYWGWSLSVLGRRRSTVGLWWESGRFVLVHDGDIDIQLYLQPTFIWNFFYLKPYYFFALFIFFSDSDYWPVGFSPLMHILLLSVPNISSFDWESHVYFPFMILSRRPYGPITTLYLLYWWSFVFLHPFSAQHTQASYFIDRVSSFRLFFSPLAFHFFPVYSEFNINVKCK